VRDAPVFLYAENVPSLRNKEIVNWNLFAATAAVWGIGCIDPHFLDLGTSWR
jgi:hypothetical protein